MLDFCSRWGGAARWICVGVCLLTLVSGCQVPVLVEAEVATHTPAVPRTLLTTRTLAPTPMSTATATPPLSATPTSYPTIVIPMLTPTITPTVPPTPAPTPLPPALGLPDPIVPDPFGVEIHFTWPDAQEMDLLEAAGFQFVRMDLFWVHVETKPGHYDFEAYDALVHELERRDIRLIFILDYGNPYYDSGLSPHTAEGRLAFTRFVRTAARRYKGHNIIWEIWNEPNLAKFWSPTPNATHYGKLAIAAANAIRHVDPTAWIIGPATSGFDWHFWQEMADTDVLKYFDAVSIHPYRTTYPETSLPDYLKLRRLLHAYSPAWRIPVISGEWGYASTVGGYNETQQAQFLARQWLFNMAHDVELSIWYDWRNDGFDPRDPEHNYGTVWNDFNPKPAYYAAKTLNTTLDGYRFLRRLPLDDGRDYVLLFHNTETRALALATWTTGQPHTVRLPIRSATAQAVNCTGEQQSTLTTDAGELLLDLSRAPLYIMFEPQDMPLEVGQWYPLHTMNIIQAPQELDVPVIVHNPFPDPYEAELRISVAGQELGSAPVRLPANRQAMFRVPLVLPETLHGDARAHVTLVSPHRAPSLLQSALVWLQIIPPDQ